MVDEQSMTTGVSVKQTSLLGKRVRPAKRPLISELSSVEFPQEDQNEESKDEAP